MKWLSDRKHKLARMFKLEAAFDATRTTGACRAVLARLIPQGFRVYFPSFFHLVPPSPPRPPLLLLPLLLAVLLLL